VYYIDNETRGKTSKHNDSPKGKEKKEMATAYFDNEEYHGEYNENSGTLTITNSYTGEIYIAHYCNKYTAKRGFGRIVRDMQNAGEG
jgi:hypothetical protein